MPKPSLHDLSREDVSSEDLDEFVKELIGANDRACALLCGSLLDSALAKAVSTKLVELTKAERDALFIEQNAVLASFANKTAIAHALGLLTREERQTLDSVRKVRNAFAHAMKPLTFKHSLVAAECKKLPPSGVEGKEGRFGEERIAFMAATLRLFGALSKVFLEHIETQEMFAKLAGWKPKASQ